MTLGLPRRACRRPLREPQGVGLHPAGRRLVGAVTVGVYPTSPAPEIEYLLTKRRRQRRGVRGPGAARQGAGGARPPARLRYPPVVIDPRGLRHYQAENLLTFEEVVALGTPSKHERPGRRTSAWRARPWTTSR